MHRRTFHFGRVNKQGHAVIELSAGGYNHVHYRLFWCPFSHVHTYFQYVFIFIFVILFLSYLQSFGFYLCNAHKIHLCLH